MLMAAEATALAAVTVAAAAGDTTTIIFALAWWTLAALIGIWLESRAAALRAEPILRTAMNYRPDGRRRPNTHATDWVDRAHAVGS